MVKHALRYQRRKNVPRQPSSLKDLTIERKWATTGGSNPERFLLYDNGPETKERIVIFSSDLNPRYG